MYMTLDELVEEAWQNSEDHGFHTPLKNFTPEGRDNYIALKLALIHSEVSEALEELREGNHGALMKEVRVFEALQGDKPVGFMSELADIMIRVADLAGIVGGDLGLAVHLKMEYNKSRPPKHNKAF